MAVSHVTGALAALKQLEPGTGSAWVTASVSALRNSGLTVYDGRNGLYFSRIRVWSALVWAHNP